MQLDVVTAPRSLSRKMGFTPDFYRMLGRTEGTPRQVEIASKSEVDAALSYISDELDIAGKDVVDRIWERNPTIFRLIRNGHDLLRSAMMAYLPLNARGVAALVDGRFDGRAPDLDWICRAQERPEALYLWLIYTPGRIRNCLRLIELLAVIGDGCPIFSRPINTTSDRILARIGFLPAKDLFPDAPSWLEVLLPTAETAIRIEIVPVRSIEMLMQVFAVRSATYMAEQFASFTEEFDGNDFCATHLLGMVNGDPAGCARIRYFGDFAKFERFAVRKEYRHTRLTPQLARACIAHVRMKGFRRVYAHAREDLVPLWERFGARQMEGRPAFRFSDVIFRELVMDVEPADQAIRFGAGPMVTIRPEGAWAEIGPLDRSLLTLSEMRPAMIDQHMKRLAH